ncbi:MAG: hypothetical protein KGM42_19440 [Hyphomicrobiales bacterium]|nr:hypothetical protein [Hyphomicrobiales bacterium]
MSSSLRRACANAAARETLEARYEAAARLLDARARMAARGLSPVTAAIEGAHAIVEWAHYPEADARDAAGRARYYYHAHPPNERIAGEHGHFHVFLEPGADGDAAAPTHIVGVAMNAGGAPIGLFTTNRWVTGESWREAAAIECALGDFAVASNRDDIDRWIAAMIHLYRVEIGALLRARDRAVAAMRSEAPNDDVLEDRSVRILSEAPVDLVADIHAIELALERMEPR